MLSTDMIKRHLWLVSKVRVRTEGGESYLRRYRSTRKNTCHTVTWSTTNPTWTALGSNTGVQQLTHYIHTYLSRLTRFIRHRQSVMG